MTVQRDPEHNETKYLHKLASFSGKRVLEIGCGEGRMTWQYAQGTQMVTGIDPDRDALRIAMADRPSSLGNKAYFLCAQSEHLPFSKETFDIAILAWSL